MLPTHPPCPHPRPGSSICARISCFPPPLQPYASHLLTLSSSQAWLVILCRDILFFSPPPCSHIFPPTHPVLIPDLAAQYVQRFPVLPTSSLQSHVSHPPTLSSSQAWQLNMCRDFLSFSPPPCSLMLPIHPLYPHPMTGCSICAEISCLFRLLPAVSCFPPAYSLLIPGLAAQYMQ